MEQEKTVFQKIIDREIPADIIYEDEHTLAFLDINPVAKGHALVVTKEHYQWFTDVPTDLLEPLFAATQKVSRAIKKATGANLVQVSIVGDEVPHVHIHLIPRFSGDDLHGWPTGSYDEGEAKETAEKIKGEL